MNLAIIGTGYVGLVAAACFANMGHAVWCTDQDTTKLIKLRSGELPFFEPGLKELVQQNQSAGRLKFETNIAKTISEVDCCFITVGTPSAADGAADISQVVAVARIIASHMSSGLLVVVKSTVPVGTTIALGDIIRNELVQYGRENYAWQLAVNPEFLREGEAIKDFFRPDRIVIGAQNMAAFQRLRQVYNPLIRQGIAIVETDINTAEMAKYTANVMLAARISLINEISLLCDQVGADGCKVAEIAGLDHRIGKRYLQAGIGYGGSCLPKDVLEIIRIGKHNGIPMQMISAIHEVNQMQMRYLVGMICQRFGEDLTGITLGIWGVSYKPDTDDVREAPATVIVRELSLRGAELMLYDPVAADKFANFRGYSDERVNLALNQYEACRGKDGLLLLTEWSDFAKTDFHQVSASMRTAIIFDGRNFFNPIDIVAYGFEYYCIGRGYTPNRKRTK